MTTTDAGMAVPDWPNTFGYNLFLYPWQSWLAGPWDLFVEHGHRLLAASVGLLTIGLVVVLKKCEHRKWVRVLGLLALLLVVFQGSLGGMRVLFDERILAMLHGVIGPLFFGLTVALAAITSQTWAQASAAAIEPAPDFSAMHVQSLAAVTAILAYLQIVLGAVLRHVPVDSQPGAFLLAAKFHLFMAAMLTLHILMLAGLVFARKRQKPLGRLAGILLVLIVVQVLLGMATWMEKYSVPEWASGWFSHSSMVIREGSWLQTHVITAHVATGSAIFGTAIALALYAFRLPARSAAVRRMGSTRLGVAL